MSGLLLTDSLTQKKTAFQPHDEKNIKMYVCGPTVYSRAHLGNVRSAVIYDLLYRLLSSMYSDVIYVRNVTDIDDKIINACKETGQPISQLTAEMLDWYHKDLAALNCLPPTHEPYATTHLQQIFEIIQKLIVNGHAYISAGHVLFDTSSYANYGSLSKRYSLEEMIAGARIEVAEYKKNPADFVLWKPSTFEDDDKYSFDSPWGLGRPGWHIECSAMSWTYLGEDFDIHGGGIDLLFPHHENELAQSICAFPGSHFAKYWVHHGVLTVDGAKMSKSLNNIITVGSLLDSGIQGAVLRYFYFTAHYRRPLDYNNKAVADAQKAIQGFVDVISMRLTQEEVEIWIGKTKDKSEYQKYCKHVIRELSDDCNTPAVLAYLHHLVRIAKKDSDEKAREAAIELLLSCDLLGFDIVKMITQSKLSNTMESVSQDIHDLAEQRYRAKLAQNWTLADQLRFQIEEKGYVIQDRGDGYKVSARTEKNNT